MNFKDISDQRIAVNCQTEKEAREFVKMAYRNGYQWWCSRCIEETYFDHYTYATCYTIMDGHLYYGDYFWLKYQKYKIIEFSDFIKEDFKMETKNITCLEAADGTGVTIIGLDTADKVLTDSILERWRKHINNIDYLRQTMTISPKNFIELFAANPTSYIAKIEVKNDTVVIMSFSDGTTEKAVTSPDDTFSLEQGISICLTKKLLSILTGGNGSSAYNRMLHKAMKIYNDQQEAVTKKEEADRLEKERAEKRAAKRAKRKAKYESKKREREISIQAEAYARALRMVKQDENI